MSQMLQLLKAAIKRGDKVKLLDWCTGKAEIQLPSICSTRHLAAEHFQSRLARFNHLHHWHHKHLHPCFSQVLGMKQHIDVLLDKNSPFPLMGLIQVQNHIRVVRPLQNADLTIGCQISAIKAEDKGITVDVAISTWQNEYLCLEAISTYLYRVKSVLGDKKSERSSLVNKEQPIGFDGSSESLHFSENAGREYAQISGDYNPIHLYPWSAKLLGFKSTMAHGMSVLAMALSRTEKDFQNYCMPCTITNQFINPVSIPSELVLQSSSMNLPSTRGVHFDLLNPSASNRKKIVLSGNIQSSI